MAAGTSTDPNDQAILAAVTLAVVSVFLRKAVVKIFVKGVVDGPIYSWRSERFIHSDLVECHLDIHYLSGAVFMASTSLSVQASGFCLVDLRVDGQDY